MTNYIGRIPQVGNYFKLDAITTSSTATYNLLKGGCKAEGWFRL